MHTLHSDGYTTGECALLIINTVHAFDSCCKLWMDHEKGCTAVDSYRHGLIHFKDTKTKCHLYRCLIEFIDWRYSQSCWYFRPSFVSYCPSNLLSGSPPSQSTEYTDSVWLGEGWGVLSCAGDHNLQNFNTLYLTRFRTYKIALPP